MTAQATHRASDLWSEHHARWRDPSQALSAWDATPVDPSLLLSRASGEWWSIIERLQATLLITREYEHLVLAVTVRAGRPELSYLALPHPSGIAVDHERQTVFVASTRNPNQIFALVPAHRALPRSDVAIPAFAERPLMPVRSGIFPGALYIHDLAVIGSRLYANSVGQNAVAEVDLEGMHRLTWWPRCIERNGQPSFDRNYLQLNSIAAGDSIARSFFTASADVISSRRPGHLNFAVDRRGVLFAGSSREPVLRGLTRPHSARLSGDSVWIDDSGYGRVVAFSGGSAETVVRLPGWTRGLSIVGDVAFVGTSRVIPRFSHYAPGLKPERSRCAIHAIEMTTGRVLGSLEWPNGNQIFAIESLPQSWSSGLPFTRRATKRATRFFYSFDATRTD